MKVSYQNEFYTVLPFIVDAEGFNQKQFINKRVSSDHKSYKLLTVFKDKEFPGS